MKAREYLEKQDDPLSQAQARLLLKELNIKAEDLIPN
jgi:hypothetical protein